MAENRSFRWTAADVEGEGCRERVLGGHGGGASLPPASLSCTRRAPQPSLHLSLCLLHLALTLVGIILGTHHEKGAFTFWSYAIGLPLPSSSILSWKFCHVLHKVLRDGHLNVSSCCHWCWGGVSWALHLLLPEPASAPGRQSSVPVK